MPVMLENPRTGDRKPLNVGWNWTFFLFGGFLGLPLFWNGLTIWGAVILLLWALDLGLPYILPATTGLGLLSLGPALAIAGLVVFLGLKGNGLIAKRYLARGYEFARPDSAETRYAIQRWGLGTWR